MERRIAQRIAALLTTLAPAATLAEPAEAVTFYRCSCSVSAGSGHYAYRWAATTTSDTDCTCVGVAWHTGSMSFDSSYPFSIDKSSATHPAGSQSWHYLRNSVSSTTKYISYTW